MGELEDVMLSDSLRLSLSFSMCNCQGSNYHRINQSAGAHHNETELDNTEGQADTVETIIEAFGTYRSTLPAHACGAPMMRPGTLPELHVAT